MKIKKIVFIILFSLIAIIWTAYSKDKNWPSLENVIDKYKYKIFFFHLKVWDALKKQCRNYTYAIDKVEKWFWFKDVYFLYRWDEANKPKHSFYFSCPLIVKWNLYYNLYSDNNTDLIIDKCSNWNLYKEFKKTKLWKSLITDDEICLFTSLKVKISNLSVIEREKEIEKKVLPNKLGFTSIGQPIILSVVLFLLILSFLVYKRSF